MKNLRKVLWLIIILALMITHTGCVETNSTDIELKDKTEETASQILWESKSLTNVSGIQVVDNLLYVINNDNKINVINLDNGSIVKTMDIGIEDTATSPEMSVYGKYMSISYYDYLLIFDLEEEKIINRIVPSGYKKAHVSHPEIFENYVMFWSYDTEKLHCYNFLTLEEVWAIGGNRAEHGIIAVSRVEDSYFIYSKDNSFIQIDPLSGNAVNEFKFEKVGRLNDGNSSRSIYSLIDQDIDTTILDRLNEKLIGQFRIDGSKNIYSIHQNVLTVFNVDNEVSWTARFESEIDQARDVGDLTAIILENDFFTVVDINSQSIVYNEKFKLGGRSFVVDYYGKFILIGHTGVFRCLEINSEL